MNILKENRDKSGIYSWIHQESGQRYIGSSIDLGRRLSFYFAKYNLQKSKGSSYINNALLKYGYSSFELEILEYCEPSKCIEREQYYIDLYEPKYNILKTAGSSLGNKAFTGRLHSDDTKKKMSEIKLGIKSNFDGKSHLEETKKKN